MIGNNHRVSPEVTLKNPNAASLTPKLPIRMGTSRGFTAKKQGKKHNAPLSPADHLEKMTPRRRQLLQLLDSRWFTVLMLVVTIYALFGDDIRTSLFSVGADNTFFSLATICLVLFTFEFLASCLCKYQYLFSFYFALDLIATFSVLPDIGWAWNAIIGSGSSSSAIKASKATQAGSKAGRIVRVVRAVRLFRVVKILKLKHKDDETQSTQLKESKVGSKMGEVTVQRVVILVLFLIMLLPVFDGGYNQQEYRYQDYGLRAIHMIVSAGLAPVTSVEYQRLFLGYVRDAGNLIYLQMTNISSADLATSIQNVRFQPADAPWSSYNLTENPSNDWTAADVLPDYATVTDQFRTSEINIVKSYGCYNTSFISADTPDSTSACISVAIFDISPTVKSAAAYNILKTFFIIIVLVAASTSFVRTTRILVLDPIERMMNIVQKLAENPLASVQTSGDQAQIRKNAKEQGFETALLEITLSKIGTLMQVGFGAAGADIIGKNMGSGELDPMLPGKKITAIYGFCDIRQFTDTTECLQEEVMVYVNKLGNIMHSGTHHYYGMANKNVGDAFLLSWKICDGEMPCFSRFTDCPTEEDRVQVNQGVTCPPNSGAGTKQRRITPTEMADSALTAFIKCMIDLDNANTDGPLTEYLKNEAVVRRFGPNFRIKMGFGMHVGWAVEGAIGSRFKIDATYISPHVEMADRLEAGSKIFATPINISHWLAALLSPGARKFLRKMDRMSIRGVDLPVTVYTFDVTVNKKGFGTPKIDPNTGMQQPVDFENDPEYMEIREGLEPAFLESAASAVEAYLAGDWPKARHYLSHAQQIRPQDGPCKHLMGVLKENNYETPQDWKGYRYATGGYILNEWQSLHEALWWDDVAAFAHDWFDQDRSRVGWRGLLLEREAQLVQAPFTAFLCIRKRERQAIAHCEREGGAVAHRERQRQRAAARVRVLVEGVLSQRVHGRQRLGRDKQAKESSLVELLKSYNQKSPFYLERGPSWMDSSTTAFCEVLEKAVGGTQRVAETSGSRVYERPTGNQIAKRIHDDPAFLANVGCIALVSSMLTSLVCGEYTPIDESDGSGMNLLDVQSRECDSPDLVEATAKQTNATADAPKLLEAALGWGIARSYHSVGVIHPFFQKKFGFSADCVAVPFSGDNPCSLAGIGLAQPGDVGISLGTPSTFMAVVPTEEARFSGDEGHFFSNPIDPNSLTAMICFKNGSRGVDGRYYQWKELADAVDFLFVMSVRNEIILIYYQCLAAANSPLALVKQGLEEFIYGFGIALEKLVLGVPWYGYKYTCVDAGNRLCSLNPAAGAQVDFGGIEKLILREKLPVQWDDMAQSLFVVNRNRSFQIWFDNPRILTLKYQLVRDLGLHGAGMWNADTLDHASDDDGRTRAHETQAIWQALHAIT